MAVLSVAIITSGRTLLARQFVEMSRLRVEGLLSAFPKLVDARRDHTFIETETVRYVYQPIELMYLLLVTNKSSNILDDLETLRLFGKVVQDCCQKHVNEELVLKHSFDIVFAFDEVISFGQREGVTISQINTYTEMDSHEENIHHMVEQSKINEAREIAKKKQIVLANRPKEPMPSIQADKAPGATWKEFVDCNRSMLNDSSLASPPWSTSMADDGAPTIKANAPKKAMTLSKKKPGDMFAGLCPTTPSSSAEAAAESQPETVCAPVNPLLDPVKVEVEEKITAELQVEGGLEGEVVCQWTFAVTVLDPAKAEQVAFKLAKQSQDFKYKVHPNLNKQLHAQNILEARSDTSGKTLAVYQKDKTLPLLKWSLKTSDEAFLPVALTCWPMSTSDSIQMVLEIEWTDSKICCLEDVHVRFPAGPSSKPITASADPGEATYDAGAQQVHWYIPVLEQGSSANLDFTACADSTSLLPYTFEATRCGQTKCPMEILECYHQEKKDAIAFTLLQSSLYVVKGG